MHEKDIFQKYRIRISHTLRADTFISLYKARYKLRKLKSFAQLVAFKRAYASKGRSIFCAPNFENPNTIIRTVSYFSFLYYIELRVIFWNQFYRFNLRFAISRFDEKVRGILECRGLYKPKNYIFFFCICKLTWFILFLIATYKMFTLWLAFD